MGSGVLYILGDVVMMKDTLPYVPRVGDEVSMSSNLNDHHPMSVGLKFSVVRVEHYIIRGAGGLAEERCVMVHLKKEQSNDQL